MVPPIKIANYGIKPKKSSGRIYTNDELYEIANEILTPKKIKFTLDKSKT